MANWLIISKLTILTYCIMKYAGSDLTNTTVFVLFALIYLCVSMIFHLTANDYLRKGLLLFTIFLLIGSVQYVNLLFILLLPLNLFELLFMYSEALWLPLAIGLIPVFLLEQTIRAEYLLISLFSLVVYMLVRRSTRRIQAITVENDQLRDKIHSLSGRLSRDLEYERQVKYSSQLEERNKIAQEIHDRVGHSIAGSLLQLQAAKVLMEKEPKKSLDIIEKVINILSDGMESIRATLRNIKPAPEQLGINRVRLLVDEFSANNQIKVTMMHKGDLSHVSHVQWKIIYDNISEALTNIMKYARASTVIVNVEVLNTFVKAEVKDNGLGAYNIEKGLGIRGMEERSSSAGGKVIIDGSAGFSVITLLPLGEEFYGH